MINSSPLSSNHVVSSVVILLRFPVDLRGPSHNTDAQIIAQLLLFVVTPPSDEPHGVQGVKRRSFLRFTRGKHPGKGPRNASRGRVLDARTGLAVRAPQLSEIAT